RIVDRRDDAHPAATVRAGQGIYRKDPREQVGPPPARRARGQRWWAWWLRSAGKGGSTTRPGGATGGPAAAGGVTRSSAASASGKATMKVGRGTGADAAPARDACSCGRSPAAGRP